MSWFSIGRAVLVRLLFAVHGVICIWRLATMTHEVRYWYLASVLGLLLVEMMVTLTKKGGKEWKWFCPSVFIYLMCVVPAIWFLELSELDKRIWEMSNYRNLSAVAQEWLMEEKSENATKEDLSANLGTVLGVNLEIRIPILLTSDEWIRTLEQLLLLLLIMGRWLLPKGKLTHDQLSQLLLVYIGTAADIVEFFDAFKEKEVRYNRILCMAILGIWSFSLIQFSLVLTATRARRDQTGIVAVRKKKPAEEGCCSPDVYGIIISIMLQDLPFLCLRLLLIFKYKVLSYTNMFFTSKNTIVIVLLIYRLIVVQIEKRKEHENDFEPSVPIRDRGHRLVESSSLTPSSCSGKSRLIKSGSSYSNGLYPHSRCVTPYREHGSCGSLGNIHRIGDYGGRVVRDGSGSFGSVGRGSNAGFSGGLGPGGGFGGGLAAGGGAGRASWNRSCNLNELNSPV